MKSARPSCTASRTLAPMKKALWRKRWSKPGSTYGAAPSVRRCTISAIDDLVLGQGPNQRLRLAAARADEDARAVPDAADRVGRRLDLVAVSGLPIGVSGLAHAAPTVRAAGPGHSVAFGPGTARPRPVGRGRFRHVFRTVLANVTRSDVPRRPGRSRTLGQRLRIDGRPVLVDTVRIAGRLVVLEEVQWAGPCT